MRAAVQNSPAGNTNWSKLSFGVALGWLAAYQYFKLPPILPLLLGQYDYDPLVAGGFMSVFALAGLLISAWVGHNLQRIGVLPLLITACAWLLLGTLAGLSWPESAALMLLARCGEAVGYAVLAVVGVILTVSAASSRDRPLAAGLWATWIPAGQILAAILAALLPEGDWRTMWTLGSRAREPSAEPPPPPNQRLQFGRCQPAAGAWLPQAQPCLHSGRLSSSLT